MPHDLDQPRPIHRRQFLGLGLAALGSSWLFACGGKTEAPVVASRSAAAGKKGLIIGASRAVSPTGENGFWLGTVDFDQPEVQVAHMKMPFFGHGMVPHPIERQRLAVFEKRGRGACEVDLAVGGVTRMIETLPNREFYGHGAFSADGKLCYAAESDVEDDYVGVIALRDATTMAIIGEFPSFGSAPHDLHLIDGGRRMVVTNGGDKWGGEVLPSVTIIDVAKRSLIEKIEFDGPRINAGHVAIAQDGGLAIVSAPREGMGDGKKEIGALSLRPAGGKLVTMREPEAVTSAMISETLSVAIHEGRRLVAATTPLGNLVTFWDLDRCRHVASLEFDGPRGVVLSEDQSEFIVSYGTGKGFITRISVATLKEVPGSKPVSTVITGSHLINYRWNA
ncbi:MAG: DUF1513 domain-containing protein [Planctomycetes bacterium]|nr:DUF1513 domain-containing protein [Planctomycetota bacterium]